MLELSPRRSSCCVQEFAPRCSSCHVQEYAPRVLEFALIRNKLFHLVGTCREVQLVI